MIEQVIEIRAGSSGIPARIEAVQVDSGRKLKCFLTDMTIPEGAVARIYGEKPSKLEIYNDCEISGNQVIVELTTQFLAEIGTVACQVEITHDGKTVTSFDLFVDVKKKRASEGAIESTNEFTALEEALRDAKGAAYSAVSEYIENNGLTTGATEEQAKQIEENKENISKLSDDIATKASAIKEKASGETIVVTDSDEAKPLGLAIDGKSEQNQYSGNQLYDSSYRNSSNNIHVINCKTTEENGIYTVTVNKADAQVWEIRNVGLEYGEFICGPLSKIPDDATQINVALSNEAFKHNFITFYDENKMSLGYKNYTSNNFVVKGDEFDSAKYLSLRFGLGASVTSGTYETTVMINAGETALPWEPFTNGIPSPNPSYPQEIRNIGVYDEASGKYAVEVKCAKGNLFDKNNKDLVSNAYINLSANTLGITIDGVDYSVLLEVMSNTTYTISVAESNRFRVALTKEKLNESVASSVSVNGINGDGQKSLTISTGKDDHYLYINLSNDETEFLKIIDTLMINYGSTALPYEPYKETTATVYLDEPLCGIEEYKDRICQKDGLWGVERWILPVSPLDYKDIQISSDAKWYNSELSNSYEMKNGLYSNHKLLDNLVEIGFCSNLTTYNFDKFYNKSIEMGCMNNQKYLVINLSKKLGIDTVEKFKQWCLENSVVVDKILEEPTFTPFEDQTVFNGLSMFYPTTVVSNDCNANMEVEYIADTKAYIDKKITEVITAML